MTDKILYLSYLRITSALIRFVQNLLDFRIYVAAANSLTRKDHDPEAVTGEPGKLFRPVCVHEESEWRPVGTPVSVPV